MESQQEAKTACLHRPLVGIRDTTSKPLASVSECVCACVRDRERYGQGKSVCLSAMVSVWQRERLCVANACVCV
jgi:hypothetical protein